MIYELLIGGISKIISVRWLQLPEENPSRSFLFFFPLFMLYLAQQSRILLSYVVFDLICFFLASFGVSLVPKRSSKDALASIQIAALSSMISYFIRYSEETYTCFPSLTI